MSNLLKAERYQLSHNWVYWCSLGGIFLLGLLTADNYLEDVLGTIGKNAATLTDIWDGMVYDSTFLLIIVSCILSFVLGQEFSWRTVGMEVSAGHTRFSIFMSKITAYLLAFNGMVIVYPLAGCIREYFRFGFTDIQVLFLHVVKAVLYSLLLNSAFLMLSILCCIFFRNTARALAATAAITFIFSLYLGYGSMLGLPVGFLPIFQIREAVTSSAAICGRSILVGFFWGAGLLWAGWKIFGRCELK